MWWLLCWSACIYEHGFLRRTRHWKEWHHNTHSAADRGMLILIWQFSSSKASVKLLYSLSHEAQWCLYGNFIRTLEQDIRHWNVIFKVLFLHSHPHKWQTVDNGKYTIRKCKTCLHVCLFSPPPTKWEVLVSLHVDTNPQKCYKSWAKNTEQEQFLAQLWKHPRGQSPLLCTLLIPSCNFTVAAPSASVYISTNKIKLRSPSLNLEVFLS